MTNENGKISSIRCCLIQYLINLIKIYKFRRVFLDQSTKVLQEMIYENLGKKGDILIVTQQVLFIKQVFQAKIIIEILFLEFIALPYDNKADKDFFSLEKNYKNIFFDENNWFSKKIAKPHGLKKINKKVFFV